MEGEIIEMLKKMESDFNKRFDKLEILLSDRNPRASEEKLKEALEQGDTLSTADVQSIIGKSRVTALNVMRNIGATSPENYILVLGASRHGMKIKKDVFRVKDKMKKVFELIKEKQQGGKKRVLLTEIQQYLMSIYKSEIPNEVIVQICALLSELIPTLRRPITRKSSELPTFADRILIVRGNIDAFKIL